MLRVYDRIVSNVYMYKTSGRLINKLIINHTQSLPTLLTSDDYKNKSESYLIVFDLRCR